ncbi:MAG: hypothetical protein K5857_10990 [Lachnospiraceae bacterium]|nr:hypothetical protein [Lachnospiraceae bacterium]
MDKYTSIRELLSDRGIILEKGMTESELVEVEKCYGFTIPITLKQFYSEMLPVSQGFPNWRDNSEMNIKFINDLVESPVKDILYLIEQTEEDDEVLCQIREDMRTNPKQFIDSIPKLTPIYGHRYMPAISGCCNPVLSIVDDDVIVYGRDLEDYFYNEFKPNMRTEGYELIQDILNIPFWSRFL